MEKRAGRDVTGISGRTVFGIFMFGVLLSTALSFAGYGILQRVSGLHKANYLQRDATFELLTSIQRTGSLQSPARRIAVSGRLRALQKSAAWCRASNSRMERRAVRLIVGTSLFDLCERNESLLREAGRYLVLAGDPSAPTGFAFAAIANRLILSSETADRIFPVLDRLESVEGRAVRIATMGIAMLLLACGAVGLQMRRRTMEILRGTEAERLRDQTRFRRAIRDAREGLGVLDISGRIEEWNPSFAAAFGVENLEGRFIDEILRIAVSSGRIVEIRAEDVTLTTGQLAARIMEGTKADIRFDDGRFVRLSAARVDSGDGVVIVTADQTEIHRQKEELHTLTERLSAAQKEANHQALNDPLTGLPNRRAFDLALAAANDGPCTLLRIDLDHFKYVNDTFGHDAGDEVLKHVAKILKETKLDQRLAARIGGDEFVVMAPKEANLAHAETLATKIAAQIRKPFHYNGRLCHYGASFGSASNLDISDDLSPRGVLAAADVALYRAKAAGRDNSALYTPALHQEIVAQRRLADALLRGLENDIFVPYYQPQVDAVTGRLVGLEVLARWPRRDGTILAPGAFLPLAEQMKKVSEIDRCIFHHVRKDMERWAGMGVTIPKIAFNASSDRLRDSGIRIEVDDFGSGHASVMALYRVRPDCLKIDRRIVAPAADRRADSGAQAVLKAVVEIGKALETEVLAEGVESAEIARNLTALGVDTLQGYHFSRPLPFDQITEWMAVRGRRIA
ncbi:putative bifunctional diguanylate cyclase/phosphodiesterase [Marimonas sp. MJW-29]|uniref:Bifunctional diguanylate cyclase/phosphodiesterase n=1 Tax=Sulfitobacter sediminis TaxID=3234186 RepID=A0ABV3RPM6_9RHOB